VHFFWGSFDLAVTRFSGRPGAAASRRCPNLPMGSARRPTPRSEQRRFLAGWAARCPTPPFYAYAYRGTARASRTRRVRPEAPFTAMPCANSFCLVEAVRPGGIGRDDLLLEFLAKALHEAAANPGSWGPASARASGAHNRHADPTRPRDRCRRNTWPARIFVNISKVFLIFKPPQGLRMAEECVKTGITWVHLRPCQTCGGDPVCRYSSPNRHARRHANKTGHPVISSAEPGEPLVVLFFRIK